MNFFLEWLLSFLPLPKRLRKRKREFEYPQRRIDRYLPVSPSLFSRNWAIDSRLIQRAIEKRKRRAFRNQVLQACGGFNSMKDHEELVRNFGLYYGEKHWQESNKAFWHRMKGLHARH